MQEQLGEQQAAVLIEEAASLVQRLKYYKITVLNIHGGGEEDAMEIFSRLNGGQSWLRPDRPNEMRRAAPGPPRAVRSGGKSVSRKGER